MSELHFLCRTAGWANHFFRTCVKMEDALKALRAAYSSGDSNSGMEDSAQSKFSGPSDNESDHSDDVAVGDVESAPKKQKTFGSELQLHNYFSAPEKCRC